MHQAQSASNVYQIKYEKELHPHSMKNSKPKSDKSQNYDED